MDFADFLKILSIIVQYLDFFRLQLIFIPTN